MLFVLGLAKLFAHECKASGNFGSVLQAVELIVDETESSVREATEAQCEPLVGVLDGTGEVAMVVDIGQSIQEVLSWNPHVVEHNESVVYTIVALFLAAVSNGDSRQRMVRLSAPQGHDEGVWALRLAIDNKLRKHDAHVRCLTGASDPELHRLLAR